MAQLQIREALRRAMVEEMRRDDRIFLMGEEVAQYSGAYKVSQGMLEEFGPNRVVDTPISECGFAGLGIGAAMVGMRPIIEFMTWNFSLVGYDQIVNTAAKTCLPQVRMVRSEPARRTLAWPSGTMNSLSGTSPFMP